ncbi:Dirigent protein [Melia azedarach]|uniref:Dirigent protein n=2 Tax=Melia azedarach TaxID=155640 RepID=A0ACC1Y5B6_MELAZ|nr:Dirigent protein [Melia azedarach]KAJ4718922.1 Dirigent protein [Melia azedarach]
MGTFNFLIFLVFTSTFVYTTYSSNNIPVQQTKQTNPVVYIFEYLTGPNVTTTIIAGKSTGEATMKVPNIIEFGTVAVFDYIVKEGASEESKEIGRAQGYYMNSQLDGKAMFMSFSLIFNDGEFKGSTLQFQGSDIYTTEQRELAVVSGTGAFRFVRGYVIMESIEFVDPRIVVGANITLIH